MNTAYSINPKLKVYEYKGKNKRYILDIDPQKKKMVVNDPDLLIIMRALPKKFTKNEASKVLSINDFDELWDFLIESGILISVNQLKKEFKLFPSHYPESWKEAVSYHLSVRDFPFLDMGITGAMTVDNEIMKRYEDSSPPPSVYQSFDTGKGMELEYIENILNEDRKVKNGINIQSLTILLDVAFGERSKFDRRIRKNGYYEMEKILKAVPSGGGRNPSEGLIVVKKCSGLKEGVYHYNVRRHVLEYMGPPKTILENIDDQNYDIFILTAPLLERAQWRYRDPRSYRAILVDIGHINGCLSTVGHKYKIKTQLLTHCDHQKITESLGLDWNIQPCMTILGLKENSL